MAVPQSQSRVPKLRFGIYEADLNSRELFKHGTRIKLQEQPFKVLAILLEHPGETVTREELRQRLWPADTFVEYEDSLNTAVRKLRAALSDSSDTPKYIETVARRGYRFVAPVIPDESSRSLRPELVLQSLGQVQRPISKWKNLLWWAPVLLLSLTVGLVLALPTSIPRLVRIVRLTQSGALHPNQKLLTDGPRIYFTERTNGQWLVKWMPTSGGTPVSIALPFHADLQDISPDGSELMVREIKEQPGGDAWILSTGGGELHPLGIPDVLSSAYTRDGQKILYARGATVSICDRDGSNKHPLLTLPGQVLGISISPNNDLLRFYVAQETGEGVVLWESDRNGRHLHRVISDSPKPRREWGGSWSPDGRWFTFGAARGSGTDVWLLGSSGWFRRPLLLPLTSGPMEFVYPIFGRDSKRIFVVGITRRGELLRYDFKKRDFTQFLGGVSAEYLSFSPDKQWLIYVSYPEGQLWRARADGSEPTPLTSPPMRVGRAYWSPDGSRIAFEGRASREQTWDIYVLQASGGNPRQVATDTKRGGLTWRPDSKSLIIGNSDENSPLQILDLERGSLATLPGTGQAVDPVLSISGRYLAARMKDASTLVAFDLVTGSKKQLAAAAADIGYASWSPDEKYLYFNRFLGTAPAAYRVRVSDRSVTQLMTLTQFSATGNWGTWTSMLDDGSLLLLRDLGGADLYAIDWSER